MFTSLALAYRPRDAPLQFSKISSRYHSTSRIVAGRALRSAILLDPKSLGKNTVSSFGSNDRICEA